MSNLEKGLSSGNGSDSMESNIVINDEINLVKPQVNQNDPKTIRNLDGLVPTPNQQANFVTSPRGAFNKSFRGNRLPVERLVDAGNSIKIHHRRIISMKQPEQQKRVLLGDVDNFEDSESVHMTSQVPLETFESQIYEHLHGGGIVSSIDPSSKTRNGAAQNSNNAFTISREDTLNSNPLTLHSEQSIVYENNVQRTTIISSDSRDQRQLRNSLHIKAKKTYLMNRLNWITYLKILYDQLEKIRVPEPERSDSRQMIRSFLSSHNSPRSQRGVPQVVIDKVDRD